MGNYIPVKTVEWQRLRRQREPLYRLRVQFRLRIRTKKLKNREEKGIPLNEFLSHVDLIKACMKECRCAGLLASVAYRILCARWKIIRSIYLNKSKLAKLPKPRLIRLPKIPTETRKRNLMTHQANMDLCEQRRQARTEWNEMVAAWRIKWSQIIKKRTGCHKRRSKKRLQSIRETKLMHDSALAHQLRIIHIGPCKCFWCGILLPEGGTADHIIALASGGTHTSDNICACCPNCNSIKGQLPHQNLEFHPALF